MTRCLSSWYSVFLGERERHANNFCIINVILQHSLICLTSHCVFLFRRADVANAAEKWQLLCGTTKSGKQQTLGGNLWLCFADNLSSVALTFSKFLNESQGVWTTTSVTLLVSGLDQARTNHVTNDVTRHHGGTLISTTLSLFLIRWRKTSRKPLPLLIKHVKFSQNISVANLKIEYFSLLKCLLQ